MIDTEALRALEKDIRDSVNESNATHTHLRANGWADRLATLIAELGQEVGAVESVWMFRCAGSRDEWMPFVNEKHRLNTMRSPEWEVREFTSPAHTSEARDAAWSGAVFERGYSAGYRAALGAASAECRRIGEALDGGGNTYVRYEDAIKCAVSVGRLSIPAIDLETFDPAWVVAALKWVATDESTCKLSRREAKEQARLICAMYNLPVDAAMRQEAGDA